VDFLVWEQEKKPNNAERERELDDLPSDLDVTSDRVALNRSRTTNDKSQIGGSASKAPGRSDREETG
jgi:hypothetical protein